LGGGQYITKEGGLLDKTPNIVLMESDSALIINMCDELPPSTCLGSLNMSSSLILHISGRCIDFRAVPRRTAEYSDSHREIYVAGVTHLT
jgi:hypothetical protein